MTGKYDERVMGPPIDADADKALKSNFEGFAGGAV
jgi:hypothetical protein